jgi:uncharacterized integral membrane protein
VLQRILLLPLLSPLLAVLLVAAINPKPAVSVRLLTWSSPVWPLGGWLAAASVLGAAMSAGGAALALQGQADAAPPRRQVRRRSETWEEPPADLPRPAAPWAGPARSAGEPAPTVSVPFRVIRKGASTTSSPAAAAPPAVSSDANDWNTPLSEDW